MSLSYVPNGICLGSSLFTPAHFFFAAVSNELSAELFRNYKCLENVDLEQDCTDFLPITSPPPKLVTRIKKNTWKEKFTPLYYQQDNWNN
jgi:hypothetical protein